jgi:SAM-dependent methyltransferase
MTPAGERAAPAPRGVWGRISSRPPGPGEFWRFNWLAHHKLIGALMRARVHAHGVLLDVGCGDRRAERWLRGHVSRSLGVDLAGSRFLGSGRPDAYARAEALPFRAGSVDTLLGLSMLTYLREPRCMLAEAHRVLRPGGTLILEFTQTSPLHDAPHDYFRFTRYGATHLLETAGFEPIELIPIGGLPTVVGLSILAALNRINRGPWRILTELPVRAMYVIVQLGCEALERMFPNPREALSHVAVARRAETPRPGEVGVGSGLAR